MLENLKGLLIPSSLSSDVPKVNMSSEMSLLIIGGVKQEMPPTARTQNSNLLSQFPMPPSQWPPSQSSLSGLL